MGLFDKVRRKNHKYREGERMVKELRKLNCQDINHTLSLLHPERDFETIKSMYRQEYGI